MIEWIIALFIVSGAFFSFAAGLGVLRLPDVLTRMHASTKAGTLGVGLILTALMIYFAEVSVLARGIAIMIFIFITAPVAAHMIARAAYKSSSRPSMKDESARALKKENWPKGW